MCNKICYSEREANTIINGCKRRQHSRSDGKKKIPVRSYYCPECGAYHTTSKEEWEYGIKTK